MELDIRPLDESTWDALAALFDEGGDPRWCWCMFYRKRGLDWSNSTPAGNRALLRDRVDEGPRTPGLVALAPDGSAVGWVSVGPRADYERLAHSRALAPIAAQPAWSIVCFVVAKRARRRGVARQLLDAAIEYARSQGATLLEAYPAETDEGERIPAAEAYKGTVPLFASAGFEVVARRLAPGAKRPRVTVRRRIRRSRSPKTT